MSEISPIRVTTINGNHFVSGLYWQPLTRPRAYMKEAREIGKQRGMDIVAIRRSETLIQGGFVSRADGAYKGMYSLAAALAGQLGDTWLGAFKLPDGQYAIVGILRGGVIPGSDMIGDLETISSALRSIYAYKHGIDDNDIYAPEEMNFGGQALDIEKILTPVSMRKEYSLKPLTLSLTRKQVVVAGALVLSVFAGGCGYLRYEAIEAKKKHDAEVRAAKIKVAEMEAINARSRAEQTAKSIVHPWSLMPSVSDFIESCSAFVFRQPLSAAGWVLTSSACDGQQFAASFSRSYRASEADLADYAVSAGYVKPPIFFDGGDKVAVSLDAKPIYAGDEPLPNEAEALISFTSHFQRLGIKPEVTALTVSAPTPPPLLPGQDPSMQIIPPDPDWKEFEFSFDTELPPSMLFEGLSPVGIRLTQIKNTVTNARMTWSVKGTIYAK